MPSPRLASLCRLSRHCLQKSEDKGNSAEHQLWLLSSGALNTAAAVAVFEGSAARCFEALERGSERGKYLQRFYAQQAMRKFVEEEVATEAAARRRWLVPENLPLAWTIATIAALLASFMVHVWFSS